MPEPVPTTSRAAHARAQDAGLRSGARTPADADARTRDERVREQLRRHELPREWRAEIGDVDGDTVLLMSWLDTLARRIHAAHGEEVRSLGLSQSEAKLLYHLLLSGPPYRQSPTRINRHLELSSGGVTKAVDRLEAAGLVYRQRGDGDGRSIDVGLTTRGVEIARRTAEAFGKRYEKLLGPLDARSRRETLRTLRRLLDALEGPI